MVVVVGRPGREGARRWGSFAVGHTKAAFTLRVAAVVMIGVALHALTTWSVPAGDRRAREGRWLGVEGWWLGVEGWVVW